MYIVKRKCYDSNLNVSPYEEELEKTFDIFDDAWKYAFEVAEEEVTDLENGAIDGVSFGIPEDNLYIKKEMITVNYYYDDNTEIVTQYWVENR